VTLLKVGDRGCLLALFAAAGCVISRSGLSSADIALLSDLTMKLVKLFVVSCHLNACVSWAIMQPTYSTCSRNDHP
jgi:hypothetical protein